MTIESLLTRPVSTLPTTATCTEAARRMQRQNIGSVVVEQDGAPVGIVTDRDLAMHIVAEERDPASVTVGAIMSKFPAFLSSQRDVRAALHTMREMGVRRLPAVNTQGRLIGMLSLDDILIELSDQFGQIKELLSSEASHLQAHDPSAD
jgi:signal-transduction protein with cAMP-binding, CBS, and nucleotidyltransferase domain